MVVVVVVVVTVVVGNVVVVDVVVVVLLHDSGSRYVGKIYNDEWMKNKGFKTD